MANSRSDKTSYQIQFSTTTGTETTYTGIKLIDAEKSAFITSDEILRCFAEALGETSGTTEQAAWTAMVATTDEIKNLFN